MTRIGSGGAFSVKGIVDNDDVCSVKMTHEKYGFIN